MEPSGINPDGLPYYDIEANSSSVVWEAFAYGIEAARTAARTCLEEGALIADIYDEQGRCVETAKYEFGRIVFVGSLLR